MPPDTLDLLRAALAGRYRVERMLGRGGMATVYVAFDERHNRQVAVKLLNAELIRAMGVERFGREIGIAARLTHPHIVPLLDSGAVTLRPDEAASPFYVMPLITGESLRARLERTPVVPLDDALRIAREVAQALDYAHRQGVVHRDIKPENILLSDGHAVVADFGLARALGEAGPATLTQAGQTLGTPQYMSPEQITGEKEIDGRSDQYSLACVLYEMLAGKPPGDSSNVRSLLMRRLSSAPPRIRETAPGVPEALEAVLLRALALDREDRFLSAGEFAAGLAASVSGPHITLPLPPVRRPRRRLLGLAGTTLVLAVAVLFVLTRTARPGRAESITSVAVAPEPADSATSYLSEGILDGVADLLRRLPQLRVTAPSLVAQMRRQDPNINALELGDRLKVQAILTWSLRRVGDSVHLSAELLRVPGGDLVWSARYGRPFAEVASIQGEIARMVSDSLRLQLSGDEYASMGQRPTESADAYDLYLRAHRLQLRAIPLGARDGEVLLDSAARYARAALARDPQFAKPQGLLATYYFVKAFRGWAPFKETLDSSKRATSAALAVDSTLGDGWLNLMSEAIYLDDDWNAAIDAARGALRRSRHDASVMQFVGIVVGEVEGRVDSAAALLRTSVSQEPSNVAYNTLGDLYMREGRFDSAVVALRHAIDLDPSPPGPWRRLVQSLERLHRYDEALAARRQRGDTGTAFERAYRAEGAAGYERVRRAELLEQVAALEAPVTRPYRLPDDTVPALREEKLVGLYAQLGEWTKAMDWAIKLRERRPRRFRLIVTNPMYEELRTDPRYLPLVKQEGLEGLLPR